jgi:hypothetical protein
MSETEETVVDRAITDMSSRTLTAVLISPGTTPKPTSETTLRTKVKTLRPITAQETRVEALSHPIHHKFHHISQECARENDHRAFACPSLPIMKKKITVEYPA